MKEKEMDQFYLARADGQLDDTAMVVRVADSLAFKRADAETAASPPVEHIPRVGARA
jgi:hypothetical protein